MIGLGSMGMGVARSLLRAGFDVAGCDPWPEAVAVLAAEGGRAAATPAEAARDATAVFSVVLNGAQTETVLFGDGGCAAVMAPGAVFVSMATLSPDLARVLAARLAPADYLDAPISGGAVRGRRQAVGHGLGRALGVRTDRRRTRRRVGEPVPPGRPAGAGVQLQGGEPASRRCPYRGRVQRWPLPPRRGWIWPRSIASSRFPPATVRMFADRMKRVLDNDYRPRSSTNIFVKDLGIVLDVARARKLPLPISAQALADVPDDIGKRDGGG